jgi:hypothetical protein
LDAKLSSTYEKYPLCIFSIAPSEINWKYMKKCVYEIYEKHVS